MTIQNTSAHEEAQKAIYRGCARLMKAMQVKRIAPSAAQRWEDEALREAREVLSAVLKCRLKSNLVIPPLPIALLEVHYRLPQSLSQPLQPSDIDSPLKQASTSWWTYFIAPEDYPRIPSDINLGDPSTFWWEEVEECDATRKVVDKNALLPPTKSEVSGPDLRNPTAKRLRWDEDEDELDNSSADGDSGEIENRASKRRRAFAATESKGSDEEADGYVYVPRCNNCKTRGEPCHVTQHGEPCIWCRSKRRRCSAYRRSSQVIKKSTAFIHRKNELIEDHIKFNDQTDLRTLDSGSVPSKFGNASTSRQRSYPVVQTKINPSAKKQKKQEKRPVAACYDEEAMPAKSRKIVPVHSRVTRSTTKMTCIGNPPPKERAELPAASGRNLENESQAERTTTAQRDIGTQLRMTGIQRDSSNAADVLYSGTAAPVPERAPFDNSVDRERRPSRPSDDSEVDFKNILVSVILEAAELYQRRAARTPGSCMDGPQSAGGRTGSTTGERADDHLEFTKSLMSLMQDVVQMRSQKSK